MSTAQERKMHIYKKCVDDCMDAKPDDMMEVAGVFVAFEDAVRGKLQELADTHTNACVAPICYALISQGVTVITQGKDEDSDVMDEVSEAMGMLGAVTASMTVIAEGAGEVPDFKEFIKLVTDKGMKQRYDSVTDEAMEYIHAYVKGVQVQDDNRKNSLIYSGVASGCISIGFSGLSSLAEGSNIEVLLDMGWDKLREACGKCTG